MASGGRTTTHARAAIRQRIGTRIVRPFTEGIQSPPFHFVAGASLTSCQWIHAAITAGTSRVAPGPLCLHAVANTPAGPMETCSLIRFHRLRLSPNRRRVGPCIALFEACSAFTHVTACTLAKSPSDSLHQRLQQSRCLHCCSDCYRVERTSSRAGLPPLWTTAFSRRTR